MGKSKAYIIWLCKLRTTKGLSILFGAALLCVAQLGGCKDLGEQQRNFQVCVTGEADRAQCKRLLDITVKINRYTSLGNSLKPGEYFVGDVPGSLNIGIPLNDQMLSTVHKGHKVRVDFRAGSLQQYFANWLSIYVGTSTPSCLVNQVMGNMLAITQYCELDGKKLHHPSSTMYVPASANNAQLQQCISAFSKFPKSRGTTESQALVDDGACGSPVAWFNCAEPRGGIAKNPDSEFGCRVHGMLRPNVSIEYQILYRHLQDWQAIHQYVVNQLNAVLTIKERGESHAN